MKKPLPKYMSSLTAIVKNKIVERRWCKGYLVREYKHATMIYQPDNANAFVVIPHDKNRSVYLGGRRDCLEHVKKFCRDWTKKS